MLSGFQIVKELPNQANEMFRKLFTSTLPILKDVQTSVPTIDTLPRGWGCIYESGSTRKFYFNVNGTICSTSLT